MSVKRSTGPDPEHVSALALAGAATERARDCVRLVRELGSCRAALDALGSVSADSIARARRRLTHTRKAGFGVVCFTDACYPRLLRAVPDPPLALSVWGALEPEDALSLAIVGSRRATRYGLEMSQRLAAQLAEVGLTIVSGLARGIDAAAHRGALRAGGRTVAVLGSGLRNIYPREHSRLAEQVAASGAVLSELPLGASPRAGNFPRRNRIITGMTLGTLIVEAALKSGSLVSARHALEQNRDVFAVPGPALAENSAGVHALIRDGAALVTKAEDILDELRPEIRSLLRGRPTSAVTPTEPSPNQDEEVDEVERKILGELETVNAAIDVDSILERVEISTDRALAALCSLEVKGLIWRLTGGLYQARP